ncbi:SH3 domain-containing protein [Pholiota molesta]|nr:SH3 domain-containing protein [Pholiota molesta]
MAPQDPQAAALLAHVLSQIEDNVNFLASQDYISQADASAILTNCRMLTTIELQALWAYSGDDADDLSFGPGDVIEIVEETNADWWTGKFRGKQGLFPSTYVQKLPKPPFGAAYQGLSAPPPAGQGVNNVGLQEAPDTEAKKDKYGKYKSTNSRSVWCNTGSAIGGGLVRAIF